MIKFTKDISTGDRIDGLKLFNEICEYLFRNFSKVAKENGFEAFEEETSTLSSTYKLSHLKNFKHPQKITMLTIGVIADMTPSNDLKAGLQRKFGNSYSDKGDLFRCPTLYNFDSGESPRITWIRVEVQSGNVKTGKYLSQPSCIFNATIKCNGLFSTR